jgi:hypothetical protein
MVERACLRYHISNLPKFDAYVSPAAEALTTCIPIGFTTSRRKFDQYISNAGGIARLHHKKRVTGIIQEKSTIFVTPEDYFLNHLIFGQALTDAALQISPLQKTIMKVIIDMGSCNKSEIQQNLRSYSINQTANNIESHLKHLDNVGYVNKTKEGQNNYFSASSFYAKFNIKPDMRKIIEQCKSTMETVSWYEEFADEYTEKFCKNKMFTINPFDGERVNIIEYEFASVLDYNNNTTRMSHASEMIKAEKKGASLFDYV